MDIVEATYLLPPPTSMISTTELIARWAEALQKRREQVEKIHNAVYGARREAAQKFERDHSAKICDFDFSRRDLISVPEEVLDVSQKWLDEMKEAEESGNLEEEEEEPGEGESKDLAGQGSEEEEED
ncbi:uncharacterized protein LAESUDRAFT_764565 [Laetiporus sulphureus 93-53]|uniref:Uncharacterized protein n=1 Tax=Laetiporus sulphureus 93-53 TaxID=1314785 RepID=A0A165B8K5_9APHY|nr:uncharacterized protein LAESUDRAFT_764565 [Laetiporus sulphureus 93-53]KZT00493.1 hypothetical protein LAESUDRAFT_764565 [Laetiporus sulphureus 93-53]